MRTFNRVLIAFFLIILIGAEAQSQAVQYVRVSLDSPVPANTAFPIVATSTSSCTFPYPESEQPPDYVLSGNELEMTVYLRNTSQSGVPNPPCINRPQTYAAPTLRSGTYKLKLRSRFFRNIEGGGFASPIAQGELIFEVAGAVPVTQIPATSGWSLALLLLGMLGAVRWVSGHSGR